VRPGSVRVETNIPTGLPNVAFKTPDGKFVVIVLNESGELQNLYLQLGEKLIALSLEKGAVATYIVAP
jgi:glucosylceramidase